MKSAQPKLANDFLDKIDKNWKFSEVAERSQSAIKHISYYIPSFSSGKVASKPLFGAQQIPGTDASLRAADVSFENERYARCEIVKASSVLTMMDEIMLRLIKLGYIDKALYQKRDFPHNNKLSEEMIDTYAEAICQERNYPLSMARRSVPHYEMLP